MSVTPQNKKLKVIIIEARDHDDVVDEMLRNAVCSLKKNGVENDHVRVMTLSSIPAALSIAVESVDYDGAILLGCAITENTNNFDECYNVTRFIHEIAVDLTMPIGLGIITATTKENALREASTKGDKAVNQCIELMRIRGYFIDNLNEDIYHTFNV